MKKLFEYFLYQVSKADERQMIFIMAIVITIAVVSVISVVELFKLIQQLFYLPIQILELL